MIPEDDPDFEIVLGIVGRVVFCVACIIGFMLLY